MSHHRPLHYAQDNVALMFKAAAARYSHRPATRVRVGDEGAVWDIATYRELDERAESLDGFAPVDGPLDEGLAAEVDARLAAATGDDLIQHHLRLGHHRRAHGRHDRPPRDDRRVPRPRRDALLRPRRALAVPPDALARPRTRLVRPSGVARLHEHLRHRTPGASPR